MDTQYTLAELNEMVAGSCLTKKELAQLTNYTAPYFRSVLRGKYPLTDVFFQRVSAVCKSPSRIVTLKETLLTEKLRTLAEEQGVSLNELANLALRQSTEKN